MNDQIIALSHQGKSQRTIATELKISPATVNRVLQRSRHARKPQAEDYIDARTLDAVRVLGRGTAREIAAFILEHSSTKEDLGDQHVAFIQASLDRLTDSTCCPEHRLTVNDAAEYSSERGYGS